MTIRLSIGGSVASTRDLPAGWDRQDTGEGPTLRRLPVPFGPLTWLCRVIGRRQTGLVFVHPRFGGGLLPTLMMEQGSLVTEYQRPLAQHCAGEREILSWMER